MANNIRGRYRIATSVLMYLSIGVGVSVTSWSGFGLLSHDWFKPLARPLQSVIPLKRPVQSAVPTALVGEDFDRKTETVFYQGSLHDIDGLLWQQYHATPRAVYASQQFLRSAIAAADLNEWGAAAKDYGQSLYARPTNDGLIGYATAQAMSPVYSSDRRKALATKLRHFEESLTFYKMADEFSDRADWPLTPAQSKIISNNVACLEAFLNSPNPEKPNCVLVEAALSVSNLN